jgi:hypothetical protein
MIFFGEPPVSKHSESIKCMLFIFRKFILFLQLFYRAADEKRSLEQYYQERWIAPSDGRSLEYNIQEESTLYCTDDTRVLAKACLTFAKEIEALTGGMISPFRAPAVTTLASLTYVHQDFKDI